MFALFGQLPHKRKIALQRLKVVAIVMWLALFVGGLMGHQGSYWVYVVFTAVFTAVLVSGLYRQPSYGYMFLTIFFWLGFWLKLSVHNIFRYDYVEPIGRFDGTAAAWDEALWVATVAGMGILLGRRLCSAWRGAARLEVTVDRIRVPLWYLGHRRTLWALLMGSIVGLAAFNSVYGIQQSGLTPRIILIWPLNGLIYWLLSTGLSMALATILWWDICLKKDISLSIYAVFSEAFLSTMSLLSRGLFVFHIIPPLVAIGLSSKQLVWKERHKFFFALVILGFFFILSLAVVSTLRSYLFQSDQDFRTTTKNRITRLQILQARVLEVEQLVVLKNMPQDKRLLEIKRLRLKQDVPIEVQYRELLLEKSRLEPVLEKNELEQRLPESRARGAMTGSWVETSGFLLDEFGYQITGGLANRVFALGVDRWIGMEGVLAISSYPQKSYSLFVTALSERSDIGKVTMYQKICQSIYQAADTTKYQFASLPGAAAFFYYTGSLWTVFLGMFFLTLMAIYSEYLVHYLTGNVLLCALVGMNAANAIAQLGVVPRQLLIHFGMLFGAVVIIWLLQSRQLAGIHRKLSCQKISR